MTNMTTTLYRYDTADPRLTSVSMFGTLFMSALPPLLKNAKLINRIGVVSKSCNSAKFSGLLCISQKNGRGAPAM